MPMMSGSQLVEEFEKLDANFMSSIRIIMLGSSLNSEDPVKFKKYSKISDFIIKPLNQLAMKGI